MGSENFFRMIEVEVNSMCNRTCSYCPNSSHSRIEQGEMKPELFKLLLTQLKEIDFKGRLSYHFYGEPLLCKNLEYFIELTKKYLPETRRILYSNGDLLTEGKILKLIRSGVSKLIVTQHKGQTSPFSEIYHSLPEEVSSNIVYINYNDLNLTNRGGLTNDGGYVDKKLSCYIPTSLTIITLLGNVLACYEDYNQQNTMGNIQDNHIKDIWLSEKYQHFRDELKKGNRNSHITCRVCNNKSVLNEEQFDYVL